MVGHAEQNGYIGSRNNQMNFSLIEGMLVQNSRPDRDGHPVEILKIKYEAEQCQGCFKLKKAT